METKARKSLRKQATKRSKRKRNFIVVKDDEFVEILRERRELLEDAERYRIG